LATSAKVARRIGTAPFSPPQAGALGPPQSHRREQERDDERASDESEEQGKQDPVEPDALTAEIGEVEGQAESGEDGDLRHARKGALEALDLTFERRPRVTEQEAGDEDGEKTRAVRECRGAIDDRRRNEGADGVQAFAGQGACRINCRTKTAPATPTASPTAISSQKSPTIVHNDASSCVANSSIPITRAMPTGSFAPDSPSSTVPERPPTSRFPMTENMTAGSVGASAAPRIQSNVQSNPKKA
jgi:hypothetical protein